MAVEGECPIRRRGGEAPSTILCTVPLPQWGRR
jgi:hypothetical protein